MALKPFIITITIYLYKLERWNTKTATCAGSTQDKWLIISLKTYKSSSPGGRTKESDIVIFFVFKPCKSTIYRVFFILSNPFQSFWMHTFGDESGDQQTWPMGLGWNIPVRRMPAAKGSPASGMLYMYWTGNGTTAAVCLNRAAPALRISSVRWAISRPRYCRRNWSWMNLWSAGLSPQFRLPWPTK